MKRFILFLAFTMSIIVGCTKEEPKTTYSFITTDGIIGLTTEPLYSNNYYNIAVDVVFSEYGGGHRISYQTIDGVVEGKKYTFEANPNTEYVTVRIDVTGDHDRYESFEFIRYIANVILLEKGKDTEIIFNPETMVSKGEPK